MFGTKKTDSERSDLQETPASGIADGPSGSVFRGLRATEPFRRSVCQKRFDGISRSRLGKRERISGATAKRWFGDYLRRAAAERTSPLCPQVLGIDEHFFTRKPEHTTIFCDLKNHSTYDSVAERSEAVHLLLEARWARVIQPAFGRNRAYSPLQGPWPF